MIALHRSGETRVEFSGLHCSMGISLDAEGKVLISQLERARIVNLSGAVQQSGYPGYLGRLRRTPTGYALAAPSPKSARSSVTSPTAARA